MGVLIRIPALLGLAAVVLLFAHKQEAQETNLLVAHSISDSEAKDLIGALQTAPRTAISFENSERTPLAILEATISALNRDQSIQPTVSPTSRGEWVVYERVGLINQTNRRVSDVKLLFTDLNLREEFDFSRRIMVEPFGSATFEAQSEDRPDLILLSTKPRHLSVKLSEIGFEDGTIWEPATSKNQQNWVDELPVPLTQPQPKHTEEALKNRIQGRVRLRLLVGIGGHVNRVKIIRGLPDGLDEQAVQEAYGLRFKPAMKAGQPVECWVLFRIDFNLPLIRRPSSKSGNTER